MTDLEQIKCSMHIRNLLIEYNGLGQTDKVELDNVGYR